LVGYASHAIEDVASHRGRTNPEHAFNSLFEENPDKVEGIDSLSVEMTANVLQVALESVARACTMRLQSAKVGALLFPEKMLAFGFSWQGNPVELTSYELSAVAFAPHKNDGDPARVRWFGPVGAWSRGTLCADVPECKRLQDSLANALR
jgi:hypothetical protein